MHQKAFKAGEIVFLQGEDSNEVYRIISGKVIINVAARGEQIVLAELGEGDIFGEMSVIDEKPRSATACISDDAVLEVLSMEDFDSLMYSAPEVMMPYMASFFERLRNTNNRLIMEIRKSKGDAPSSAEEPGNLELQSFDAPEVPQPEPEMPPVGEYTQVKMKLANSEASSLVSSEEIVIDKFPYNLGRDSGSKGGMFARNDFVIRDQEPWKISRAHASIGKEGNKFFVNDRGSTQGTLVNGKAIGIKTDSLTAPLQPGKNTLILGAEFSPFRFDLIVE